MNISVDLERLNSLHKEDTLSDEEFTRAKRKLLNPDHEVRPNPVTEPRPGAPANQDFVLPIVMIVVVVLLLVIFLFAVVPHWHHWHGGH